MHPHPENFPFSQRIYHKTRTFDIWQQTNGKDAQSAWILQLQKQLSIFNQMFLKKFRSQNVYQRPKHMHSDDIANVWGKSSQLLQHTF